MADPQEKDGGDSAELDDIAFLRTGDTICISCNVVMASRESMAGTERVCLAAEGFGNRTCFLENISDKNNPPDLTMCGFVIEQALSVRALQEMIAKSTPEEGTQSGHRTLLYGHAVLLRHNHSNMFLSCLSTQTTASSDKLAFDVGLKEDSQGESCWWTIHPASKQRSEGEKVRVGDDVILVSVATERYLHTTKTQNRAVVIASFHQTLWSVSTVCSGSIRAKTLGSVFGADVLRFFKNVDECLTVPPADSETKSVLYESGEVMNQARSLWRLELIRTKWSSAFVGWTNLCRIRHITTGRYLCVNQDNLLNLVSRDNADVETTAFCLRQFKDDKKVSLDEKEEEGMGSAQVKYSDSMAFIQHVHTGLWLSYETHQTKKKGVGRVEEKIAVMLEEGHMDDGFTVVMAQEEESRSARVIRKCSSIFNRLVRALNSLQTDGAESALWHRINLNEVVMCLGDLILYFEQPPEGTEHEEKQQKLKALRNRQDLFQEEGMIALVLEVIDEFSMYQSPSYFAAVAGEEAGQMWEDISSSLYLLLAAMIKGNHSNCAQFADSVRLDWLFNRLESQQASEGVLDVLHGVLINSPEALNMIKERHIKAIISLLDKHGRDPMVLNVLCSLCVGNGMAVRSSQNHICDNLLPSKDLLLQTSLVDHVSSMRPNIFVCVMEGSAMYKKWYFEAVIDYIESSTHLMPHLRIGWANTEGYKPYPGGGENWGGNGVGDDLYSYGFDGGRVWAGGKSNSVQYYPSSQGFSKGDVIGCFLDFTVPEIAFSLNGVKVNGVFRNFNTTGLFFPCISLSAKVSARFMFGNEHGKFRYGPHDDFSPIIESMLPREQLRIEPCMNFGDIPRNMIGGPIQLPAHIAFIPTTVDTSKVVLPNYIDTTIDGIREKLAENIHELWSVSKIEAGYTWGEVNDEQRKKNVCLTTFEKLPETEKNYNIALAQETLKTFFALGYHIRFDKPPGRLKTLKLPNHFLMANGYKPTPLDMRDIPLNEKMEKLVDLLADNTHNVWARDHIQMQWTYGLSEDHTMKRSPHLVPYDKVDDSIKKKNRDTASETVRTLMAYGYGLDSPPDVADSGMSSQNIEEITSAVITYRGQKTYAVMSGKWYYEFEVLTTGFMKLGWVSADHAPNKTIGNDEFSYGFDGFFPNKWHQGRDPYGKKWTVGDVIGVFLDLHDSTVSFSLNGELMMDSSGSETAFSNIEIPEAGFVPAFSIGAGQLCKLNMGQDVNTLKFFTQCGLQEGYEPFCVNMTNNIIMWYNKELGLFQTINELDTMIEITRIPPGSDTPPIMHVAHKTYGSLEGKSKMEFLRLSVPVQCQPIFTNVGMTSPDSEPGDISIAVPTIRPSDVHVVPTVAESTKHGKKGKTLRKGASQQQQQQHQEPDSRRRSWFNKKAQSFDENASSEPTTSLTASTRRASTSVEVISPDKNVSNQLKLSGVLNLMKGGGHSKGGATAKPVHGQQKSSKPFKFLKSLSVTKGDSGGKTPPAQPSKKMNLLMPSDMAAPAMPSISVTGTEGETMLEQIENSRGGGGGGIPMQRHSSLRSNQNRQPSGAMSTQSADSIDMEMEYDPNAHVDTDVYFYAVRIFPGQDPVHVNVGWVQPYYHYCSKSFTSDMVRQVMFTQPETAEKQGCLRQNCYMVNAKAMQMEAQASGRKVSQGLVIGCYVDTTSGMLTFSVNGTKVDTKYQVEPNTKLMPAVFAEATSKEMLQFELGRAKGTLPLSAALNKGPVKDPMPQCPSRLAVQRLTPLTWGRVPQHSLKVHTLKLSEIRGWSMLCEDPVSMLAVQIPEEDRCIDVLELIEQEDLLMFHACTLKLYCAICFRGNHRAAHILCGHVDKRQFMYLSQSKYLAGPLRKGFLDLLIALHLTAHVDARLLTQKEYILPLTGDIKSVKLSDETNTFLPSVATTTSIRPQMKSSPVTEDTKKGCSIKGLSAPEFELDCLKQQVMSSLADGVQKSVAHCRDPIGGSYENLFVPLLKLADCLLVIGLLDDDDIYHLMVLIDPVTFNTEGDGMKKGLLHVTPLDEGIQLQLCNIFHHLCDINLRHRVESIIAFCDNWVDKVQIDQLKRYIEIKKADLQPAVAAKRTREFRCPPKEQMRAMLTFRTPEDLAEEMPSPCNDNLKEMMLNFNKELLALASVKQEEEEEEEEPDLTWQEKLIQVMLKKKEEPPTIDSRINQEIPYDGQQGTLNQLIARTVMKWGCENFIEDQSLIREMFSLLHRQYDGVGELCRALEKTYTISVVSKEDFEQILVNLSQIRALLEVQLSVEEEVVLRSALWDLMNNKIFFQHPDLMRALCVHENVMRVMVNTLNKSQVQSQSQEGQDGMGGDSVQQQDCSEMVTSCCRFLCYFCRSSAANQRASFEHLSYFLDNSTMLVARPSLRGSAPLDVAYSSLMDNNELALALRETHLEKVAVYLSRCGLQSNAELLDKGYPDIGWDPVEGERYLDFMRFCVWVNGECVEENANLVIRLLIRRPECLGPALRGEGGGLLKAMKDGIRISQEIAVDNAQSATAPEDDEDYIDMGGAILTFYAALVDLLGRCAPDAATIHQAKSDSIRARAILRSLVSMEDLEGCLSLHFMLPNVIQPDKADDAKVSTGLPPGLLPCHRQAVLLFMERVYGIPDQETFFRLLEDGLLPDLRTAVLLDTPEANDSDLALALNRYLCQSVLPLLTNYAHYFHDSEHYTELLDATLQTSYRISKCATLTKVQREVLSDFLVAFTRELRPVQMLPLLRKLIHDVPSLNEYTHVSLNILNLHYERCGQYYGSASGYGTASEDEKRLTMMLFSCIFDSLANRAYDPNLFAKALPCLSAIGCALSPDYTLTTSVDDEWFTKQHLASMYTYTPTPVDTSRVQLPPAISDFVNRFAEQYHDAWASRKLERGWTHADSYVPEKRLHPRLKPFDLLTDYDRRMYREPIEASLRAMLANGWSIASGGGAAAREAGAAGTAAAATGRRRSSMQAAKSMGFDAVHGYSPKPVDMTNLSLTKEMQALAERLAENAHDIWARKTIDDLRSKGGGSHPNLIPYDMMTDREKRKERLRSLDMVKFLQLQGYKLSKAMDARLRTQQTVDATDESGIESRFAHSLLTKLLGYLDRAGNNLNKLYTSRLYSRRNSYVTATEDVKFFGKVALPLVERYFVAHRVYFLASGGAASMSHASIQEKELVGSLFCKLASLLRSKFTAFGSLAQVTVKSLEVLVQAIDAGSVVKSRPDFVRALMQPFFNNAADDLTAVMDNMLDGTFLNIKETARKSYCTLNYAHMVLLPVLTALFNHLGVNNFGKDLLVEEIQLACYKILNSLYTLGVSAAQFRERRTIIAELDKHRSALGQCLGAFASTFPVAFLEPDLNKNNQYSLVGRSEEHSLEAQDIMSKLAASIPTLEAIISEVEKPFKFEESPHVIEVMLPMLCSYLAHWWSEGPDTDGVEHGDHVTMVTSEHLNTVLSNVLHIIKNHVSEVEAPWMNGIAACSLGIVSNSTADLLNEYLLPIAERLKDNTEKIYKAEENIKMGRAAHEDMEEAEEELQADFQVLVRDIYAFYPLLIKYVDLHRSHWLKHPRIGAVQLFTHVAEVFTVWHTSQHFRREEQKFVSANAINNMALIMPTSSDGAQAVETPAWKKSKRNRGKSMKDATQSLNVACLKRMLPIGLTLFGGREQELVQHAKQKLLAKENEEVVEEYVRNALIDSNTMADPFDKNHWQRVLYNKIGSKTVVGIEDVQQDGNITVSKIMFTAKTLEMLHIVEHPHMLTTSAWGRLISTQRKRAVVACFRMISLHSLPRHRAINLFLLNYIDKWLSLDACGQEVLVKNITNMMAAYQSRPNEKEEEEGVKPDPLNQLVICFSRHATTEQNALPDDFLYIAYTELMSKSCGGEEDDDGDGEDEEEEDDGPGNTLQEQEMGKQKLLFEQGRLADRYVAEMVLLSISACRGEQSNMMLSNLQLGISCLMDGNINVQKKMLQHLQDKKDSDFFTSLSALMDKCSVLDLDAFERNIKAEKLGVGPESAGEQNMHDYLFTCKLFRFLQLLCEGHNLDFQNYLRTQTGNTVSVNLVICIVDYMLRLQESVMDFYWHYSSKEVIDQQGKENFKKAIKVGEQVFNTLTEAIQGPCVLNQMALAHSRLWDAVGGFFFLFAHMQNKLAKNTSQLDLMTQIMQFQNDMVTMMISMLEGNVMNGTIGKQMVDTLMESKANVEMILKFFDMFLKLKNIIESPSFLEYTKEGFISPKDFIRAMEAQKIYSPEEIMYLTECAGPRNAEGHIDYNEFCNRFHTPANDIGFNLAVLLTNLSEHMPNDPRLSRFCENASSFLEYFEPTLGRIEILGGAGRIERVYFEINPDHKDQWEKPQIKESKRSFLHNVVNEGGEKEKLDMFVNFCEDSIFEMQHASSISPQEEEQKPVAPTDRVGIIRSSVIEPTKAFFGAIYMFVASCLYLCRWSNIRKHYQKMRKMSKYELCVGTLRLSWAVIVRTCWITYFIITTLYQFVMLMMRGPKAKDLKPVDTKRRHGHHRHVLSTDLFLDDFSGPQSVSAFGVAIKTETSEAVSDNESNPSGGVVPERTATQMYSDDGAVDDIDRMVEMNGDVRRSFDGGLDVPKPMQRDGSTWTLTAESSDIPIEGLAPPRTKESLNATSDESVYGDKESSSAQARRGTEEDEEEEGKEGTDYHKAALIIEVFNSVKSFLARNFYTLKTLALVLAFCINFILLFYKVTVLEIEEGEGEEGEEEAKAPEWVHLEEDHSAILDPTIRLLAFIHSAVAFSMLIAYYYLKVPLFIFKREKEVCRSLLFDGLYVAEQPSEDDIKAHWDKLVISTRSFPENYWDKFIKKSVQQKYSEQYDHDAISLLLGMDEADSFSTENPKKKESGGLISFIYSIDWKYQIWKSGVILTNNSFLYIMWYFLFSVLGNFNYFFFASHLLDVVMSIKALSTIMQSITHNGKQLCLTLMMMTIIVYIYTVLAFNFFRKFYVSEGDDGEEEHKCHTMAACFLFHLYVGVRAGGGIGDEIEAPDGDQQMFRFVFDITFFFFVIVILLAIIQGLIIDAFGELRGQLEQVKEDMESQCFICGIGKEYFDKIPHGFDTHVLKEHDLANYLFFLMYLIDKPETDYTGQETYVWELYQKRSWDFFPVGDCFRKQYENEIMAG